MTQWLRALAALLEGLGSILSSHTETTNSTWNSSPRGPDTFFWLPRALGMHVVHRHTCRQSYSDYIMVILKI